MYSYQKYTALDTVRHLTHFHIIKKNQFYPRPVTDRNASNSKGNRGISLHQPCFDMRNTVVTPVIALMQRYVDQSSQESSFGLH